jgi:HSP20 family protein
MSAHQEVKSDVRVTPPVDVIEDATGITLIADMPGVAREALTLSVDDDTLTIEAPFLSGAAEGASASYAEVRTTHYHRSFTLSRELDSTQIDATLKDGVLNLRVPKIEKARPRRIEVRAA